jgi:preprotein translocase subunit SecA
LYTSNKDIIHILEEKQHKSQLIEIDALDEIKSFIPEIVSSIIASHQGIPEAIETLSQITGMSFLEDEFIGLKDTTLVEKLTKIIQSELELKISNFDPVKVLDYLSKVYLWVIDKHWMNHIDEMQTLREKVGLYGYAQIDPLVIYKKESFEKFQSLLTIVKQETLSQALKTDYHQALNTATQVTIQKEEELNEVQVINLLKDLTKGVDVKQLNQFLQSQSISPLVKEGLGEI